jgi:hypothetical protein
LSWFSSSVQDLLSLYKSGEKAGTAVRSVVDGTGGAV